MNSWIKLGVLALLAIAVSQLLLWRQRGQPAPSGVAAPAFTLPDVAGKSVSLASLKGKVVAVNFWATWCGPCQAEIPELSKVYAEHGKRCFELLGIAEESGSSDVVLESAMKLGANYPILLDERGDVAQRFGIGGYPSTFVIDARGEVRKVFAGGIDGDQLRGAIEPLLKEAGPSCPRA